LAYKVFRHAKINVKELFKKKKKRIIAFNGCKLKGGDNIRLKEE